MSEVAHHPLMPNARMHLLNALPNLLWTALCAGPVCLFCARRLPVRAVLVFGAASVLLMLLPRQVLQHLELSRNAAIYRRLRVPLLIHFTQDGAWMRRLSGGPLPSLSRERAAMATHIRSTWVRERFHLAGFAFFLLCALTASLQRQWLWCGLLLLLDTGYNLYPIWLQQFLRMRFQRLSR